MKLEVFRLTPSPSLCRLEGYRSAAAEGLGGEFKTLSLHSQQ
jgi:hypothetical protein